MKDKKKAEAIKSLQSKYLKTIKVRSTNLDPREKG